MTQQQSRSEQPHWLGGTPAVHESTKSRHEFNEGKLWIGRHAADQDTLVFDPAESDPFSDPISFYSLTQHRKRSFPRSVVLQRIQRLTDDIGWQRAKHDYDDRAARRREYEDAAASTKAERMEHQRQSVLVAHRRYLDDVGIEFLGVAPTPAAHRPGRRSKCHACGIDLDDFAGTVCAICKGVLCSCGACACRAAESRR